MSRTSSKLTAPKSGPSIAILIRYAFFDGECHREPPPQHALDLSHPKPKFLYESLDNELYMVKAKEGGGGGGASAE